MSRRFQRGSARPARTRIRTAALVASIATFTGSCAPPPPSTAAPPSNPPAPAVQHANTQPAISCTLRTNAVLVPANGVCADGVELLGVTEALDGASCGGLDVGGLSGLGYDAAKDVYLALVDNEKGAAARFFTLRLPIDKGAGRIGAPTLLQVTTLQGATEPFTGETLDGEGIALIGDDELLISSEREPSLRMFSRRSGVEKPDKRLTVAARYLVDRGNASRNGTFEGLAATGDRATVFVAMEDPLRSDVPATAQGTTPPRLRMLRYGRLPSGNYVQVGEYFYVAEPGQAISEIVALDDMHLLVLERSFAPGIGNSIRVFRADLTGATDVTAQDSLSQAQPGAVAKSPLVDLGDCHVGDLGLTARGPQSSPLLDNFEAMALGPTLHDGRRTLVLISDNNFNTKGQTTRLAVLAFRP